MQKNKSSSQGDAIFSTKKTPYHFLHFQNTKISTLMPQRSKIPKSPLFQNTIFSTYFLPFYRNLHSFRFQIKYFLTSLYYWKIISTIAYIVVYDYWQIVISIYQGTSGLMKKLRGRIQNETAISNRISSGFIKGVFIDSTQFSDDFKSLPF